MPNNQILLGCDPEVFVFDTRSEQFVSGHGLIPGTKDNPHLVENGMVQVDGMALEFGIDPSPDEDTFFNNIKSVMQQMQDMLPAHLQLRVVPIAEFSQEIMDAQPPEALELGCEPDFNCYTLTANPRPNAEGTNFRSGGGHVHVGWGTGHRTDSVTYFQECGALVAELDYTLGIPSLAWDKDKKRRQLYGKAGAFRPKSYGLEYRSLSNQWVASEETIRYVFRNTIQAIENLTAMRTHNMGPLNLYKGLVKMSPKEIINTGLDKIGDALYV